MVNSKKKVASTDVLVYRIKGASQGTVRRQYYQWRFEQEPPLPERCDNPKCFFHINTLIWNDKPIKLILDHKNGNHSDNRPKNLQLLCPNCNSQLKTYGGGNKGKVRMSEGGFGILSDDGKWNYVLPAERPESTKQNSVKNSSKNYPTTIKTSK